jgi:hypothetical protein
LQYREDFPVRDPRRFIKGVSRFLREFSPLLPPTQELLASPVSIAENIVEDPKVEEWNHSSEPRA